MNLPILEVFDGIQAIVGSTASSPSRQMSHVANVAPPCVAFRRPVVWHCDESRVGPIPGSAKMTIWTNASPTKKFIDRRYIQQIGKNSTVYVDSIVSLKEV